jgi:methylase of polypeptide subunit release factors
MTRHRTQAAPRSLSRQRATLRRREVRSSADGLPGALRLLRNGLREADYTAETLQRLLGISASDDVGLLNHAASVERIATDRSLPATLIRLFFLEVDEDYGTLRRAWLQGDLEALAAGGLFHVRGRRVRARVRLDPVAEQYVIADRRFERFDRWALHVPYGDPVYPPSSDSLMLRDAIPVPAGCKILDLCTGSGIQALQCSAVAERIVAVDVNPRAAAMVRLNAHLNGLENIEARVGDLYAPVAGKSFDLIIANPPFVASPYATAPSYHSGGPTGDRVLRRIVAGLGGHLRPGGRAVAISHVALRTGEELNAVVVRWFKSFPGRVLVLALERGTPVDLAAAQALFALQRGLAAYATEVQRWVAYLRRHRIQTVALILVIAERSDRRSIDVVDAAVRFLPIPLSPAPRERIAGWLNS